MLDPPAKEGKEGSEPTALEQQPKGHMGCPPKECKNTETEPALATEPCVGVLDRVAKSHTAGFSEFCWGLLARP